MLKKTAYLMVAIAGLASISSAAIISCTPNDGTTNVITAGVQEAQPSIYTCAGRDAGANNDIIGVAVNLVGSFNDGTEGTLHQLTFTAVSSINGANQTVITELGDLSGDNGGFMSGAFVGYGPSQLLAPGSTVTINWSLNGLNLPKNATVVVSLETQERSGRTPEVPEPSTMALFGTSLLGLGLVRRWKR